MNNEMTVNKMIETVHPGDVFELAGIHLKVETLSTSPYGSHINIEADAAGDKSQPGWVACPVTISFPKGYGFQTIDKD